MHVANPLGHRAIDVFINPLLSNTPEPSISKIFTRLSKPVCLTQSNIVHRTHSIIIDPRWPRGVPNNPLGHLCCLLPCSLPSSLLFSLVSDMLINKNPFIRKPKVPLANSRTTALITTMTRTRVTCERRWEKQHGDENTKVEKMARKNMDRN
jgi:hypothetical protein